MVSLDLKATIRDYAPPQLHSAAITAYNTWQFRQRHGGVYPQWRDYYRRWWTAPAQRWQAEQERRLGAFLHFAEVSSPFHRVRFAGRSPRTIADLRSLPELTKDELREHFEQVVTLPESQGSVSFTGGTTGASLKVVYRVDDLQERWAVLDDFRSRFGYKLGRRTAWFGGRDLLPEGNRSYGPLHRDNYLKHIRFFSTFHINAATFDANWQALDTFSPEYLVGYPSSVYDLCYPAYERGWRLSSPAEVFFATAESLVPDQVKIIEEVMGCRVVDQYASSEGAPFILECLLGGLHLHPLTGVFEVVDGELLVTSFATRGTPLIRYRIGDRLTLGEPDQVCDCGCTFPLVERIDGRSSDFLFSPVNGRCNLANVSTCTKNVAGIVRFQAVQDSFDRVDVLIVPGDGFAEAEAAKLVEAMSRRVGHDMTITWRLVAEIPAEASGKQRIVKNNIAHLVPVR
jgi:phenylacetate-CoA ligase